MSDALPGPVTLLPVDGVGEVTEGADLAGLVVGAIGLQDGDVLVVTSKVVSKAEGRVRRGARDDAVVEETDRTVARRGRTAIVRTRHGLVIAAAGVDESNTEPGSVVLLPLDPDASARRLREHIQRTTGINVAVLVTDTAGRAWRHGQTDIAIGAAGMDVLHDHAGRHDPYGNELAVTAPAVADELAAAAELVKGKLGRRPAAVVRGLGALVLPSGRHGPGAVALVRQEGEDMFGLGAREAVLEALHEVDRRGFGSACPSAELLQHLSRLTDPDDLRADDPARVTVRLVGTDRQQGATVARLRAAAFACGWQADPATDEPLVSFRPGTP